MSAPPDNSPRLTMLDGGDGVPVEPTWTKLFRTKVDCETAHEIWTNVIREMQQQQTLSIVNGPAIKRLVMFHVEFERQARAIATGGVIRKAKKTHVPQVHPSWTVMKQAAEAAASLETELAISPRRRNNGGKVQRKAASARAADRFLKPVP